MIATRKRSYAETSNIAYRPQDQRFDRLFEASGAAPYKGYRVYLGSSCSGRTRDKRENCTDCVPPTMQGWLAPRYIEH